MHLTKVTSLMRTRMQLDERSFEELLAAAYQLQQQREPLPFPPPRPAILAVPHPAGPSLQPAQNNEDQRLAALAEAHAIVHGKQLSLEETLHFVVERAVSITGGAGAAIWLIRGQNAVCQASYGASAARPQQSLSIEGSRLTPSLRHGELFRCIDAASDPRTRYDALPGDARGSLVVVPIYYEGQVQGALEVTFAHPWGFGDSDVRTCQILSGLIGETVASHSLDSIRESERATLLDALQRLQPHLSKLLDSSLATNPALHASEDLDETPLPPVGLPPAPAGPTHGLARLGQYLLDHQEHSGASAPLMEHGPTPRPAPKEVQTALNFSVAPQQVSVAGRTDMSLPTRTAQDDSDLASDHFDSGRWEYLAAQPQPTFPSDPGNALEPSHLESSLSSAYAPWAPESSIQAETAAPLAEDAAPLTNFWRARGADVLLAASALVLAASLTWALWPRPQHPAATSNAVAAAPAEPKLSAFDQLLVDMGVAEAPPPPVTYTGTPGTRVWVDLNSALYYCPGAEPYGKTPKGRFLTQHEAQLENFQPARGQPCD